MITRSGEWIGRDWLRVNRGGDPHAGVLEREQRLKQLRVELARSEENARDMEARLADLPRISWRRRNASATRRRAASRARIASTRTCSASSKASAPARRNPPCAASAWKRRPRKSRANRVSRRTRWRARAPSSIAACVALDALDSRRAGLENEREERREAVQSARARWQAAQLASRDLLIRIESRRSSESSMGVGLKRMADQRAQTQARGAELEAALANGDAAHRRARRHASRISSRAASKSRAELATERRALEEADGALRALDEKRLDAEARVNAARAAMEQARLAAQESRVRREGHRRSSSPPRASISAEILAGLAADAGGRGLGRVARRDARATSRSSAR